MSARLGPIWTHDLPYQYAAINCRNIARESGLFDPRFLFSNAGFPLRVVSSLRSSSIHRHAPSPFLHLSRVLQPSAATRSRAVPLGTSVLNTGQSRHLCFTHNTTTPLSPHNLQTCLLISTLRSWSSTVCTLEGARVSRADFVQGHSRRRYHRS
jgi:hypothetical protein